MDVAKVLQMQPVMEKSAELIFPSPVKSPYITIVYVWPLYDSVVPVPIVFELIYGDLTGDGKINSADLLKMRQHLQGTTTLSGAYLEAGMLANNGKVRC